MRCKTVSMANLLVLRFFVLATICFLFEAVNGFVFESSEYDDRPDFRDGSGRSFEGETSTVTLSLAESEVNKEKKFALALFFKTNWFRAAQYCRYRGMRLASVVSAEEESLLESQIESVGFELGPTWTSGTDLSEEGAYFWASTGTPVTFTKWGDDHPASDKDKNCLYINNDPREGFAWHDGNCANEYYFACEYFSTNISCSSTQFPLYV